MADEGRAIQLLESFRLAPSDHHRKGRLRDRPDSGWIPVAVPGGVHEALVAADKIEHPYLDDVEAHIRWIEKPDWWYETTFQAPPSAAGERLTLVFDGLDTEVDIWLNGEGLGHRSNMFVPAAFDVTDRVRADNTLLLRFAPPLAGKRIPRSAIALGIKGRRALKTLGGDEADPDQGRRLAMASTIRKATFSWGWDFGPRVPSVGIWQPVRLVRERTAVIAGHHFTTTLVDTEARTAAVALDVEVDDFGGEPLDVRATLTSPAGDATDLALREVGPGRFRAEVSLVDAALWWTHDLGDPALHALRIELATDGVVLDRRDEKVGVRTIEIDRSPDREGGRYFRFLLNGFPIFARGAAWLPPTMLVGSTDDDAVRDLVTQARDGNMNMLRVWGGGVYGPDSFYDACDRAGILVWQDFGFACIDYPSSNRRLQDEVTAEAVHQVRRLRSHPSLALWCGNNEVHMIHGLAYEKYTPGNWGWHFFHQILPETVAELDGSVAYWPGSPWGEDPDEGWMAVNGVRDGDRHAWEVWHGYDLGAGGGPYETVGESRHYRRYANDNGKFISEFGIHAAPELSTIAKWTPGQQLELHDEAFAHRNRDFPKNKHDAVLEIVTGPPTSLEEYVDFTMVSQAEGLKFGIEHYRHRAPHNSGTLVWQLNDVWPGFSWSVIDYEGVPKAGYFATRRAFAPVLASFHEAPDGRLGLWVSNSTLESYAGELHVEICGLDGGVVLDDHVSATVGPNDAQQVWVSPDGFTAASGRQVAWVAGEGVASNRYLFGEVKDLDLPPVDLVVTREPAGPGQATIRVRASAFAYFVHVEVGAHGVVVHDNYVDLRAGEEFVFQVSGLDDPAALASVPVRGYAGQQVQVVEA